MEHLLSRSVELGAVLESFLALGPAGQLPRFVVSRVLCSVALQHGESAILLTKVGNFTSAVGLIRLQYEALVRAVWSLYAASDGAVEKLAAELTTEKARKARNMPMLSVMLKELDGRAPSEPMRMLREIKEYSWGPLSSFVHGGIHAVSRHRTGYPVQLLDQAIRNSNGISMMVGMLLVILSGDPSQQGKMPQIQVEFADCLPPFLWSVQREGPQSKDI